MEGHVTNVNPDFTAGLIPIQNISYGVQDVRFTRVVAFVVVGEDPRQNKTHCDCFVYLCDSKLTARKIAYALARAFKEYGRRIQGAAGGAALSVDLNDVVVTAGGSGMTSGIMVPLEEADESKCDGINDDDDDDEEEEPEAEENINNNGTALAKTKSTTTTMTTTTTKRDEATPITARDSEA